MISMKMLIASLTIVLIVLLSTLYTTTANLQCKNRVMNIVMTQCSGFGRRARRDIKENPLKIKINSGEIGINQYHNLVKRQLTVDSARMIPNMSNNIMQDMINGAITGARFSGIPHAYPMAVAPGSRTYLDSPQYYVAAPAPAPSRFQSESRFVKQLLPQASGDNLGFDLTSDEVDELFDEISNRISRNSGGKNSEEIKRNIIQAAAKCCQNEELCLKEQSIIPCI